MRVSVGWVCDAIKSQNNCLMETLKTKPTSSGPLNAIDLRQEFRDSEVLGQSELRMNVCAVYHQAHPRFVSCHVDVLHEVFHECLHVAILGAIDAA